ncbi:phosphoribosyl-dephospho-CoA transferase [Acinetobacter marinus]|uniref:Phosphoribosyl-dephospho-CoA transferase n=1 Tax=Acinetobacter marinus TaxID=281375 RepID=A0A1G6JT71_9GAMM|nr:malonate decarboxylase holo-[acyl-carrier-protein] synthase [Acinetobacter marinus]SDC21932.1 phosphoribosyl-dephospho-CoA transferase [Acinetobacter marinus]
MDRHDFAYLCDSATIYFLDRTLPECARQKVHQLLKQNIPMTVCRQDHVEHGQVKLAINCLVDGCKYRVACLVDADQICSITRSVSLDQLLQEQHASLNDTALHDLSRALLAMDCEVYVYGSYAYQYLTKETYVRSTSDLDLVLYPQQLSRLAEILQRIEQVQAKSQIRFDGEIKVHSDWHVSFNELISVALDQTQQIIVKGLQRVDMLRLEHLFAGNLEYANRTVA